jgi:hypothetical protein
LTFVAQTPTNLLQGTLDLLILTALALEEANREIAGEPSIIV